MVSNKRRALLSTLGTVGFAATSGCLGWFRSDDSSAESDRESENSNRDREGESNGESDSDDDDESGEDENGSDHGEDADADEGGDSDEEEDEEYGPSEEQQEYDPDEYADNDDDDGNGEVNERDGEDVETTSEVFVQDDGMIEALGVVHNVSDDPIDAIDIELIAFDSGGEGVGTQLETIRDLGSDSRQRFTISMGDESLSGDPESAEIEVTLYDHS